MKCSICIPTLNAEAYIGRLIPALKTQSLPCDILIIDSSSEDKTVSIAESFGAGTITIQRDHFDHGGTRNLAAANVQGEVIVFMTQDAMPLDTFCIENLVRPLLQPDIAASFGRQVPRDDAHPTEKFARHFNYAQVPLIKGVDDIARLGIKTYFFSNVCSAIRRKEFNQFGGFPERTIMNEDIILAARLITAGYRIAYEPSAAVYHTHNYTLGQQFRRYFDIGVALNRQRWILDRTTSEKEGTRYLREAIRFLLDNGKTYWIPYLMAEAVAKYTGYRLGLLENRLPASLKERISMHRHFWNQKTHV